jgi:hypothetical protein
LTNVTNGGLLLEERENMAADGDMYAQRKVWGFPRLCAAARDNAPTEKLVEIEKKCISNMLSNGYAVPSLRPSIEKAYAVLLSANTELGLESANQLRTRLIESIHKIGRDYIDAPSSDDVSKIVRQVALEVLEGANPYPSKQKFEEKCCDKLLVFWLHRFGWDSFSANVMKNGRLSRKSYEKISAVACQQAKLEVSELIHMAMQSRNGRLSRRILKREKPIIHTLIGLNVELK